MTFLFTALKDLKFYFWLISVYLCLAEVSVAFLSLFIF